MNSDSHFHWPAAVVDNGVEVGKEDVDDDIEVEVDLAELAEGCSVTGTGSDDNAEAAGEEAGDV